MNKEQMKSIESMRNRVSKVDNCETKDTFDTVFECVGMMNDLSNIAECSGEGMTGKVAVAIGGLSFSVGCLTTIVFGLNQTTLEEWPENETDIIGSIYAQINELERELGGQNE